MELIERYLHAVRHLLPRGQQDDIIRELGEDLRGQVEARQEDLGRSLTLEEQEALLLPLGHPAVMAARYRKHSHLIGPLLLPYYVRTLEIALLVGTVVQVLAAAVTMVSGAEPAAVFRSLGNLPGVAVTILGWVTLAFVAFEYALRYVTPPTWSPRALPPLPASEPTVSRRQAIGDLIGHVLFVTWWVLLPSRPMLAFGPAAAFLGFGSPLGVIYLPVLLTGVASLLIGLLAAVSPVAWGRAASWWRVASQCVTCVVAAWLLRADQALVVITDASLVGQPGDVQQSIAVALRIGTVVVLVITVVEIVKSLRKLLRQPGKPVTV